jgi:hypothetical protein
MQWTAERDAVTAERDAVTAERDTVTEGIQDSRDEFASAKR